LYQFRTEIVLVEGLDDANYKSIFYNLFVYSTHIPADLSLPVLF